MVAIWQPFLLVRPFHTGLVQNGPSATEQGLIYRPSSPAGPASFLQRHQHLSKPFAHLPRAFSSSEPNPKSRHQPNHLPLESAPAIRAKDPLLDGAVTISESTGLKARIADVSSDGGWLEWSSFGLS